MTIAGSWDQLGGTYDQGSEGGGKSGAGRLARETILKENSKWKIVEPSVGGAPAKGEENNNNGGGRKEIRVFFWSPDEAYRSRSGKE